MASRRLHREYSSLLTLVARAIDIIVVFFSAVIAYNLPTWPEPLDLQRYQIAVVLGCLLTPIVFTVFHCYGSWRGRAWISQIRTIALAWAVVIATLVFIAFITKTGAMYSRQWLVLWGIFGFSLIVTFRATLGFVLRIARLKGWNHKRIVIIGAGNLGRAIAKQLREAMATGLEVYAFLDDNEKLHGTKVEGINVKGDVSRIVTIVEEQDIDEVWVALPFRAEKRLKDIMFQLRHNTVDIRFVPDIFNLSLINHSITEIAGLPVLNLSESPMHGINGAIKNIEDKVLAFIIMALASPLMLVIAVGVKISSPGPVFFRQERVSWNGKPFTMLKFRSMPMEIEEESGPVWAKQGEDRATQFGAFIRKTSLDELPQFINVLKGDMSIVGPRPERPMFVTEFKDKIPEYMKKHLVKAGITGWAQINGWRGDTDLKSRIEYDMHYIKNWSLWFDLKIITLTLFRGFMHKNAY